ncbi:MAG: hypothetical protein OFPI_06130 [Osedax symbiont Rs2]|nr:MAG: hypothetical protein OFPI_06130 [Osedax symbiont Rs2]
MSKLISAICHCDDSLLSILDSLFFNKNLIIIDLKHTVN